MKKTVMALLLSLFVALPIVAAKAEHVEVPSEPSLSLACNDKDVAIAIYEQSLAEVPYGIARAAIQAGICQSFSLPTMVEGWQNNVNQITPTVPDWEGNKIAVFEMLNTDPPLYLLILNPGTDGKVNEGGEEA